jgi:carboxyl-terminal processing protease
MSNFFKYRAYVLAVIVLVGGIFGAGYYVGQNHASQESRVALLNTTDSAGASAGVDFEPFWKAWNIINEKYIPSNSTSTARVDDQSRVYGAIAGMVASLGDPYTTFFPPAETKSFNEEISGQIEGVGMEVDVKDGVLTVISPVKGTPADRAGIKAGDKILKIDDTVTDNLDIDSAINLIRGKKGTSVKLTLARDGVKDPIVLDVVRDYINLPTVDTETKDGVFVIHLYSFSAISPDLFRDALREFVQSGNDKLVIDLRGNPGGYLEAAVDMASWFLPAGKVVVQEDFRNQSPEIYRSKGYNIFNDQLKLAILIDGGSASASEILSGALHDQGVATLVGEQSYGKGSVQELVDVTDDTQLKVTIARWLTPNGISISHQGLTRDVVVKFDPDEYKKGDDVQLDKAIEILNSK